MDKLTIYWSDEDGCYICESQNYPEVIGIGDTEEEALEIYEELLELFLN